MIKAVILVCMLMTTLVLAGCTNNPPNVVVPTPIVNYTAPTVIVPTPIVKIDGDSLCAAMPKLCSGESGGNTQTGASSDSSLWTLDGGPGTIDALKNTTFQNFGSWLARVNYVAPNEFGNRSLGNHFTVTAVGSFTGFHELNTTAPQGACVLDGAPGEANSLSGLIIPDCGAWENSTEYANGNQVSFRDLNPYKENWHVTIEKIGGVGESSAPASSSCGNVPAPTKQGATHFEVFLTGTSSWTNPYSTGFDGAAKAYRFSSPDGTLVKDANGKTGSAKDFSGQTPLVSPLSFEGPCGSVQIDL